MRSRIVIRKCQIPLDDIHLKYSMWRQNLSKRILGTWNSFVSNPCPWDSAVNTQTADPPISFILGKPRTRVLLLLEWTITFPHFEAIEHCRLSLRTRPEQTWPICSDQPGQAGKPLMRNGLDWNPGCNSWICNTDETGAALLQIRLKDLKVVRCELIQEGLQSKGK